MQVAMYPHCCQNVAIFAHWYYYSPTFPSFCAYVANIPMRLKNCKIIPSASRASLSTTVPPAGSSITGALLHWFATYRQYQPDELSHSRMPSTGATNRQLPTHNAMWPDLFAHSPPRLLRLANISRSHCRLLRAQGKAFVQRTYATVRQSRRALSVASPVRGLATCNASASNSVSSRA